MESKPCRRFWSGRRLGKVAPFLLPSLIAAALLFALPADSRSQGDPKGAREKSEPPPACAEWHRGAGEMSALDLGKIKRAYAGLKERVAQALDRPPDVNTPDLARAYDAGLPACRGEATRTESLPPAKGARFRGKTLYFLSANDLDHLELPPDILRTAGAEILILQTRHLKDLPEIARRLGRPVSLSSAEFAKALGVRCANTWLKISEKGDELELHETR